MTSPSDERARAHATRAVRGVERCSANFRRPVAEAFVRQMEDYEALNAGVQPDDVAAVGKVPGRHRGSSTEK